MKTVINICHGGFGVSEQFAKLWNERHPDKAVPIEYINWGRYSMFNCHIDFFEDNRSDPDFVKLLEEVGPGFASSDSAILKIVDIPDNVTDWEIDDYDGVETVICVVNGKIQHY